MPWNGKRYRMKEEFGMELEDAQNGMEDLKNGMEDRLPLSILTTYNLGLCSSLLELRGGCQTDRLSLFVNNNKVQHAKMARNSYAN